MSKGLNLFASIYVPARNRVFSVRFLYCSSLFLGFHADCRGIKRAYRSEKDKKEGSQTQCYWFVLAIWEPRLLYILSINVTLSFKENKSHLNNMWRIKVTMNKFLTVKKRHKIYHFGFFCFLVTSMKNWKFMWKRIAKIWKNNLKNIVTRKFSIWVNQQVIKRLS